jgi:beta-glucosidase/6-phospho-beta-glucosidase/beta-galactosidase/glycosyltransferase involved in cell wall biosynthesis
MLQTPRDGSDRADNPRAVPMVAAFESTFQPLHGVDVADTTGHTRHWRRDIDAAARAGARTMRYPIKWHRIEAEPGRYDFAETDAVLGRLRDIGVEPIVDLVHHTSYPHWLSDGFRDPRFGPAYLRYCEAVARRYPWLSSYTLFNEPFATLFLSGHEGLWPPYGKGMSSFVDVVKNVMPAVSQASAMWDELLPDARHVWVDTCESHGVASDGPVDYVELANDRRFSLLDLALGNDLDADRPFLRLVLEHGGEPLFDLPLVRVDMLGLDYYCHSEWWYDSVGGRAPSPQPKGFAAVAREYHAHYGLPMMLAETNIRGLPTDRLSWFKYMLEQSEQLRDDGIALDGFCWFPYVDSSDWDSLLARAAGRPDPVGVVGYDQAAGRVRTVFAEAWEAVAGGADSASLPAYRFQTPCSEQLAGYASQMAHWDWIDPPADHVSRAVAVPLDRGPQAKRSHQEEALTAPTAAADLVVLTHLRWTWVWQRPQHLVSRFAATRAAEGGRTLFVEEPVSGDVSEPCLRTEQHGLVTRMWLEVPAVDGVHESLFFDDPRAAAYGQLLDRYLRADDPDRQVDVLLYTPMALDVAEFLAARTLAYDVMDDLASFLHAPEGLRLRQQRSLATAHVAFAGGRSLYRSIAQHRRGPCHLYPSGVETGHYAAARELRANRSRPADARRVAGYVGVIDERVDLGLIEALAAGLPDWTVRMVGPVTKIDPASLPALPNIEYLGLQPYADLPAVMADFDVALMPFALNEATRSISPTKTLEYLAAGLPVVSTPVRDVVDEYSTVVHIAADADAFIAGCVEVVEHALSRRDARVKPLAARHEWDVIAAEMDALIRAPQAAAPEVPPAGVDAAATA